MPPLTVVIIGAGPGGYAAALDAAQRGFSVTLVDRQETGGTCLNRGCIPSKFFLSRGHESAIEPAALEPLTLKKDSILAALRQRMDQAVKTAAIRRVSGSAHFVSPHTVEVMTAEGKTERLDAEAFILATGTIPVKPALFPPHPALHDSTSILTLTRRPDHLVVIGGGYIGSELACAFQGLGSRVTLIEKEAALLATQPEFSPAAGVLQRAFQKRGVTVLTGTEVQSVQAVDDRTLSLKCSNGETLTADAVLLALGRRAEVQALALDATGLSLNQQRISVNAVQQTAVPHIYAIGDLVSPLPLAHTATKEAEIAVAHLAGETLAPIDYSRIPRCIYTWPEAAAVGLTEAQAQGVGHVTRIDRYHNAASAKAMVEGDTEGFWAITSDTKTGKILGALIVGAHATELIHLVALSLRAGFTTADIADTVFAHPSLAEGFHDIMKRVTLTPVGAAR
jgi:dihydrolipoamide dehydrogenase